MRTEHLKNQLKWNSGFEKTSFDIKRTWKVHKSKTKARRRI